MTMAKTASLFSIGFVGAGKMGRPMIAHLQRAGHRVTVVERGAFGAGCSHANCGYVCPSHVLPFAAPGAIWSTLKTLFQRNSTFLLTGIAGAFVFERVFDPAMDSYFFGKNKGKQFSDLKLE